MITKTVLLATAIALPLITFVSCFTDSTIVATDENHFLGNEITMNDVNKLFENNAFGNHLGTIKNVNIDTNLMKKMSTKCYCNR